MSEEFDEMLDTVSVPDSPVADSLGSENSEETLASSETVATESGKVATEPEKTTPEKVASDPPAEKPEAAEIPTAVALGWKRDARALKRQLREVQQKVEELSSAKTVTEIPPEVPFAEPDPMDAFMREVRDDPEAPVPVKVLQEQRAWQERKAAHEAAERTRIAKASAEQNQQVAQKTTLNQSYKAACAVMSEEAMGDLALDEVRAVGEKYLTEADYQAIKVQPESKRWKTAWTLFIKRTLESGSDDAADMAERVKTAQQRRSSTTAKPSQAQTKTQTQVKPNQAPSREDVLKKYREENAELVAMGFDDPEEM